MLEVFYEDRDIIVVKKPAGIASQAGHSFEPDMVSEIRNHIRRTAGAAGGPAYRGQEAGGPVRGGKETRGPDRGGKETGGPVRGRKNAGGSACEWKEAGGPSRGRKEANVLACRGEQNGEPYVGVIHRLDKPVSGIMVYAKTKAAAGALSAGIQGNGINKTYRAVVCGKFVDNVGNFVDYLLKDPKENRSRIVEKGVNGAKRAELCYRVLKETEEPPAWAGPGPLTLVEIGLLTGRHHQIRVQFAGRGLPLWGDARYGAETKRPETKRPEAEQPELGRPEPGQPEAEQPEPGRPETEQPEPGRPEQDRPRQTGRREALGGGSRQLALCACGLAFQHPSTGEPMSFFMDPDAPIFGIFEDAGGQLAPGIKPHT